MSSNDLLRKAIETTAMTGGAAGGLLNPKQSNRFLDFVVDQSVLLGKSRVVRMREPQMEIDKVSVAKRIMRKATEGNGTEANADATFEQVSLQTTKLRLDWRITTEALEDNIERDGLEDHVASLMARQTSNDLEDLGINGDTTASGLLAAYDGYWKLVRSGPAHNVGHVVDAAGGNLTRATFDKALRSLPNKYLQRRSELAWNTSSSLVQDYIWSLTLANGAEGASSPGSTFGDLVVNAGRGGASGGANGDTGLRPFGIPLWEVPLMDETADGTYSGATGDHGVLELTFPNNRIFGIQRDITLYREFKPKTDSIEYTQYIRSCVQVEHGDAYVHVKNVKVRSV